LEALTERKRERTMETRMASIVLTWSNETSRQWNPSRRWVTVAAQGKGKVS